MKNRYLFFFLKEKKVPLRKKDTRTEATSEDTIEENSNGLKTCRFIKNSISLPFYIKM